MAPMGQHTAAEVHTAAGAPLRRAHFAAWFTFIFMAGTTITFQTYHSVETGKMPWPLAVLYGIAAFILAITVLEFARHSGKWIQAGAYALTAGAMYLSASATGDVTVHAAPPHAELLFGFLLDGAAILAIYFIFNGPTAGQAVARVARREAELTAAASGARSALDRAVAEHRKSLEEAEARYRSDAARAEEDRRVSARKTAEVNAAELERLQAELAAAQEAAQARQAEAARVHQATVSTLDARINAERTQSTAAREADLNALQERMTGALRTERNAREQVEAQLATARSEAEAATAKAEALTRKLDRATGTGNSGSGTRKQSGTTAKTSAPAKAEAPALGPDDLPGNWDALDTEARVLFLVNEKGYSGSKAGVTAGVTDARGRQIVRMARDLDATAPQDVVSETETEEE